MNTVSKTIYFDISSDITTAIDELIRVREEAKAAGMIEGTGTLNFSDCVYSDTARFEFERAETEKERISREKFKAAAAEKTAKTKKVKEDKERAEYERLKAIFESAK